MKDLTFSIDHTSLKDCDVEVRCMRVDSPFELEMEFPPKFSLKVNNRKEAKLADQEFNVAKRRKDFAFTIVEDLDPSKPD